VDPVSRRDFWKILYDLLKVKVTIFCSTSYLDEAERCRRVGLMHKGKLLRCDTPDKIKKECNVKTLQEAFIAVIEKYESK
jgi:ABC-2 type transport system ATP-binding protein